MSDSNSICFICLHRNDGLEKVTISDIHNVNNVTEVKFVLPELAVLLDPEIPAYHCCSCRTTLHAFYTFKKKCLENYTRLIRNSKIYNNKQIINEKQNAVNMEVQITHNYKSSSPLPKEPDVRKAGTEDNIVVKEEIVSEDNVEDRQYYQQQLEFVKCETVSDNEQDGGSSSENDQLKDETHMNYQDDSLSLASTGNTPPQLPKKSERRYEKAYNIFMTWCKTKKIKHYSETVLLDYFTEKSTQCNAATLWSHYSMVKSTLLLHDHVDISKYTKLLAFLKKQHHNYKPVRKTKKVLSREQIEKFILQAPDEKYLMMKVAVIFGIAGACTLLELTQLQLDDIQHTGGSLLVTIRESSRVQRMFTVVDQQDKALHLVDIYRRYTALRPPATEHRRLFVLYKRGKCSPLVAGKHTLGKIPKEIAMFLKLPNAELYTGHCFRRSSASLLSALVCRI